MTGVRHTIGSLWKSVTTGEDGRPDRVAQVWTVVLVLGTIYSAFIFVVQTIVGNHFPSVLIPPAYAIAWASWAWLLRHRLTR